MEHLAQLSEDAKLNNSRELAAGLLDRDSGFSSAEYDLDADLRSPTDVSEDSVEVKVRPIAGKNKRKCAEPRRVGDEEKRRRKDDVRPGGGDDPGDGASPFRPWGRLQAQQQQQQAQPLSLVLREGGKPQATEGDRPQDVVRLEEDPRSRDFSVNNLLGCGGGSNSCSVSPGGSGSASVSGRSRKAPSQSQQSQSQSQSQQSQQRNYKNMTRERRIEANARERTRVHTISAAFDTLRRAVPAYSHNQKLSKLSVLRIACSYILTLSRVAGSDYSADQSEPDLSDCVESVSKTIQMEGKLRKKKDEY